ncbi:Disintegrin and metalloproteinase domain-containing protein isoform 4 [Schistosoma japonicum]|uniref:Disintegrin and metalloproteinase domain-containing protein isoform 4 n=1 Tax=Schistosoma japonicum TaxID=6182 RepID=A0A4Z2DM29_SCHJA|nr:Disintegrin and metalloproteinase domain-containing protein isoform 4 [Schistosoma japonicum]
MHVYRLCLFLGYIAFRILIGAEKTLATSDSFSITEYNEGNSTVIGISCNLFLRQIITIFIQTCHQPTDALRFNLFTEDVFDQNSDRLFCITSYKLQGDDLKFINVTSSNVYGLFFISKNRLKGYVNITSSEICPSSCTLFIDTVKQQQMHHSINSSLYSATTCHQLNATHNFPTSLLNSMLFMSDSNVSYNVQRSNQVRSINSLNYSVNFESLNFYNNIFKRTKRSSTPIENTSSFDTVRVVHRPSESQPYVLELFMIVDEILVAEFRGRYHQLVSRINMIMAHVNKLFAPFNIVIVIVRLEIWEQDRVSLKVEEHHLLTALAQFKRMYADVRHDCLHALLGTKEQGSRTRGKANHMTMCIYSRCVGYSRVSPTFDIVETARTVAHELGHNFGLRHDTEECECQGCIMATGVEFGTTVMKWSPCSIRDLPGLLNHGMGVCLHDLPVSGSVTITSFISNSKIPASKTNHDNATIPSVVHIYDWQSETKRIPVSRLLTIRQRHSASSVEKDINGLCGNGILDPGEECDCGTQASCPEKWQACCDPVRCRLRGNSECAGGPCCDIIITTNLQQNVNQSTAYCKLKSSGTICRNESGTCDLPEYCDGHSQWCPPDVYKMDGELCYTEEGHRAHCVRGGCREADGWCRVLWGKTGKRADKQCFFENEVWNRKSSVDSVANCGIQRPLPRDRWEDVKTWTGIPCQTWPDTSCGRLWCHHQNEKAMLLGWIQSQTRVIHSSGRSCSALVYDPVWPASDPATWDENKSFQINANGAGVGLYSANTQDAGMVPDGTPCSRGFCYNGSCKSVDDVRPRYSCYCNRHGICNNLGHCHCLPGYKPPYCNEGGNGGSIDSGPPPKTNIKDNTLLIVICMLFFVILPLMGFGVYYVFIRSGRCLLSTSKEFIYTSSGLRKPCDENCAECFCQLFNFPVSYTELRTRSSRTVFNSSTVTVTSNPLNQYIAVIITNFTP